MNRRMLLGSTLALGAMTLLGGRTREATAREGDFEITRTKEEWRALLTPEQYRVLREEGTERPFTSPLNDNKEAGLYHCAGCDNPLYSSETKYDSRTGWPSFWDALEGRVGTSVDYYLVYPRTEVHCARCGGHQGHVFDDGPKPTGKRHCINGVALTFRAGKTSV